MDCQNLELQDFRIYRIKLYFALNRDKEDFIDQPDIEMQYLASTLWNDRLKYSSALLRNYSQAGLETYTHPAAPVGYRRQFAIRTLAILKSSKSPFKT